MLNFGFCNEIIFKQQNLYFLSFSGHKKALKCQICHERANSNNDSEGERYTHPGTQVRRVRLIHREALDTGQVDEDRPETIEH